MITLNQYLQTVNNRFQSGISREHSYRGDFENLLRGLLPDVEITNEPVNVTDCGNPDFVLTKKNLADVFRAANVKELLSDYGKSTQTQDPIL